MAVPSGLNNQAPREPFPKKVQPQSQRMSGDLIVMATLIGLSRAFFGSKKGPIKRAVEGMAGGRGRSAEESAEIPAKGWKDIAWRVFDGVQNHRVLLVAAGRLQARSLK